MMVSSGVPYVDRQILALSVLMSSMESASRLFARNRICKVAP